MKKVKTKVPFVPGLVRVTPPASRSPLQGASGRAPVAELRASPSRRCPVCTGPNATIVVRAWAVEALICQQCFNTYVQPLRQAQVAAGGLLDLINRFL
jgi:hypothetical protein